MAGMSERVVLWVALVMLALAGWFVIAGTARTVRGIREWVEVEEVEEPTVTVGTCCEAVEFDG